MAAHHSFDNPSPVPGVDLYELSTLPINARELPPDRAIPTQLISGCEDIGHTAVRFTLEVPEEVRDPVPLEICHGWFGTQTSYVPLRNWCAANGKPTLTYWPSRKLRDLAGYHPAHVLHPQRLLYQSAGGALRGVQKLPHIDDLGVDASQFDMAGHSMGGRTAASVAAHAVEKDGIEVRSVTLLAAAGLEPHSVPEFLLRRIPRFVHGELWPALREGKLKAYTSSAAAQEFADYVISGGTLAIREGLSIGSCTIHDKLRRLSELGIKSAMLGFKADAMIPAYSSIRTSGNEVDIATIFPYEAVGHLGPQTHPEAVGQAQFELLDQMNGTHLSGQRPARPKRSKALAA